MNQTEPKITPEILNLIAEIDEFKGSWKTLKVLTPERLASLKKVATIESIGSSTRIEGAKLSDRQIETLLSNIDTQSLSSRDEEEVAGYAEVMEVIFDNWETIPVTENYIKQLHAILMRYSTKDAAHRGNYKTVDNHVEAFDPNGTRLGILFQTSSPMMTVVKMQELVDWTRDEFTRKTLHPLLIVGIFIVRFLAIHPFQDGNGRISRAITTLLLLKSGYIYVPYSSLETIVEESKDRYYLALRLTQKTLLSDKPDFTPWLVFFLQSLKRQKDRLVKKLEREQIMLNSLPELSVTILELAREHGRITTGQIEKITGTSRSNIKARVNELIKSKKLVRNGKGRSTWYSLA